jgi:hypothetical protein
LGGPRAARRRRGRPGSSPPADRGRCRPCSSTRTPARGPPIAFTLLDPYVQRVTAWILRFDPPPSAMPVDSAPQASPEVVRVAIKDAIDLAGTVTTAGSPVVRDRAVPARPTRRASPAPGRPECRSWEDHPDRTLPESDRDQPMVRYAGQSTGARPDPGRIVERQRGRRGGARGRYRAWAPTPVARSGSRPRAAGSSASRPPWGAFPPPASGRWRPHWTLSARSAVRSPRSSRAWRC